jgi:hypothetical protein
VLNSWDRGGQGFKPYAFSEEREVRIVAIPV